jgi:hypothetical protein
MATGSPHGPANIAATARPAPEAARAAAVARPSNDARTHSAVAAVMNASSHGMSA